MLQRRVDADYLTDRDSATPGQTGFWLRELRTPELLVELARQAPGMANRCQRERDRLYWLPLKAELERLRRLKI